MLSLEHVSHRYGHVTAVDDCSLVVAAGEVVCLVGPSGCGKTTLLRVAAGLEPLQAGTVRLANEVVAMPGRALPPEGRGIGFVFQDYALFPHLDVGANVAFGLSRMNSYEQRRRVDDALMRVGMGAYANAWPHQLSGGQQQRVALARALAPQPRIILLDEPFSGLDAQMRQQVRHEALHLLRETGIATLMVTHDPEEAMFMGDHIAVMRHGRIVQYGTPDSLYLEPADAFVAGFLGEVNRLLGTVRGGRVDTVLGAFDAGGHADGTLVEVLVRPEALAVVNGHGTPACSGEVFYARFLGRSSLIDVAVDGRFGPLRLHARVPGRMLPVPGTRVGLVNPSGEAFVFAAEARD
ncbi:MAG: ABC transporter ATP-binding protein [Alphaproteobacteria bacterium]